MFKPSQIVKCVRPHPEAGLKSGRYEVLVVIEPGGATDYHRVKNTNTALIVAPEGHGLNGHDYPWLWDADRFEAVA